MISININNTGILALLLLLSCSSGTSYEEIRSSKWVSQDNNLHLSFKKDSILDVYYKLSGKSISKPIKVINNQLLLVEQQNDTFQIIIDRNILEIKPLRLDLRKDIDVLYTLKFTPYE